MLLPLIFFSKDAFAIPKPAEVRGIYITGETASRTSRFEELVNEVDKNPLNAVVIDVKENNGIFYKKYNLQEIVKQLHEKNIYVIARQVVFKDSILAKSKPTLMLRSREGVFANPVNEQVRNYNIDIALDVVKTGIDEIQFDYIRFPDDYHGVSNAKKIEAINTFLSEAKEAIKKQNPNIKISADVFGYVAWTPDIGIGQKLEDIAKYVDIICPMAYPSHYSYEHRKLGEYKVIEITSKTAIERLKKAKSNAEIRPWIQGFKWRANLNNQYILNQVKAIRDTSCTGFMIWNAENVYTIPFNAVKNLNDK